MACARKANGLAQVPTKSFQDGNLQHAIRQGGSLNSTHLLCTDSKEVWQEGRYKVLDPEGNLVAMVEQSVQAMKDTQEREATFKTLRVFGPVS